MACRPVRASVVAALLALLATEPYGAEMTADELGRALQRRYDSMAGFSADFVHVYRGGVLRKPISERGRVLVKKPGKMRWDYSSPEKKLFVSDGVKLYSYIPEDRQVIVSAVPRDDALSTPAMFLAGKGDLTRDFVLSDAQVPAGFPAGLRALKLVPIVPQPDYAWLVLVVDADLVVRGLVTTDAQGGESSLSFVNLKENVGLSDTAFTFKIPRGVEVITDAGR
jgi:outer membrane lipoprotein carrier protein